MCDQDEKKQGNVGYESIHASSINAFWPKRLTRHILPHACGGGQKMAAVGQAYLLTASKSYVIANVVFDYALNNNVDGMCELVAVSTSNWMTSMWSERKVRCRLG